MSHNIVNGLKLKAMILMSILNSKLETLIGLSCR